MADVVGSVETVFTGDVGPLEQAAKKAEAAVARLSSQISQLAKKDATSAAGLTGVLEGMSKELTNMGFKGEEAFRKNEQGAKKLNAEASKTAGFFQGIAKTAAAFGIGLTLHDAAQGMVRLARETLAVGDQMSDLSAQFGISVRLMANVRAELDSSGSSLEQFATSVRMLQRNLADGVDQTDAQGQAFKRLGITAEDAIRGMSDPDDFLLMFARKLSEVENQTERNALAFQLMGRAGIQQVPALMALAKGTDQVSEASIAGYKALGNLSDGFVNAKTKMQDFAAGILANTIKDFKVLAIGALYAAEGIARFLSILPGAQKSMGGIADEMQRMRLEDFQGPQSHQEVGKPYVPGADPKKLKEAADKVKSYTESLNKQIIALQAQQKALTEGEPIAERWRMMQEAQLELGGKIPPVIQQMIEKHAALNQTLATANFERGLSQQVDALVAQRRAMAEGESASQRYLLRQAAIVAQGPIITASTRERIEQLIRETEETRKAEVQMRRLDDAAKMLNQDSAEWASYAEDIGKVALAAQDAAVAFEKMRMAQAGAAFDQDSTEQGQTGEIGERTAKSLTELDARMFRVQQMSAALGGQFDSTSAKIAIQKERIEALTMAYGPLDTQVQEAVGQLQSLTLLEGLENVIDSAGRGVTMTLEGILTGTQTVEDGFRNLARNVALSMLEMTLQVMLIQPALNALKSSLRGLMEMGSSTGGNNGGGGLFGWLGGLASSLIGGAFGGVAMPADAGSMTLAMDPFEKGGLVRGNRNVSSMLAGLAASLPQYASGGGIPIMAHQGEYVLNRKASEAIGSQALNHINSSGKLPGQSQMMQPSVIVNGDVIQRAPWMTKQDVFQFNMEQAQSRGPFQQAIEQRFDRG